MSQQFEVLCSVAEGTLSAMDSSAFTSREFGECLHCAQPFLPPWDRYRKPLRRGAVAGQVLRELRTRGLVVRCGSRRGGSWWQRVQS